MVKFLPAAVIILWAYACTSWKPLHTHRENNDSGRLKLQGYYYRRFETYDRGPAIDVLYLFQNGVLQNPGVIFGLDFKRNDALLLSGYATEAYFDNPDRWGGYTIQGDSLVMERWAPGPDKERYFRKGKILNDSTFTLADKDGTETYHFRYLPSKPDSTNRFVH